jgi:hypothetical protein
MMFSDSDHRIYFTELFLLKFLHTSENVIIAPVLVQLISSDLINHYFSGSFREHLASAAELTSPRVFRCPATMPNTPAATTCQQLERT